MAGKGRLSQLMPGTPSERRGSMRHPNLTEVHRHLNRLECDLKLTKDFIKRLEASEIVITEQEARWLVQLAGLATKLNTLARELHNIVLIDESDDV
jgi:hypothetical protein